MTPTWMRNSSMVSQLLPVALDSTPHQQTALASAATASARGQKNSVDPKSKEPEPVQADPAATKRAPSVASASFGHVKFTEQI
eukprot:CAMPEP_0206420294 /NCGR_PEP_ID=MMETSP0324_2-20121206/742_1 /ASSEMBLY_ACC=CAM_ASM_000836 /TAXON_ID=2866 /ORGANISM="Crypthecodinium cohnii, Strain Seligo" /LENGTH=82 /DNA_ID=CAMNT_0053884121 /DNA_START=444 /DNA_END=692 /DNA_ORIENTATION=+